MAATTSHVRSDDAAVPDASSRCSGEVANCVPNSCEEVAEFWESVQRDVAAKDVDALSKKILYPVIINDCTIPPTSEFHFRHCRSIKDPETFRREFPKVFPEDLRREILAADPHKVWCNYLGAALGEKVLWAYPGNPIHITVINHPGKMAPGWR